MPIQRAFTLCAKKKQGRVKQNKALCYLDKHVLVHSLIYGAKAMLFLLCTKLFTYYLLVQLIQEFLKRTLPLIKRRVGGRKGFKSCRAPVHSCRE